MLLAMRADQTMHPNDIKSFDTVQRIPSYALIFWRVYFNLEAPCLYPFLPLNEERSTRDARKSLLDRILFRKLHDRKIHS